MSLQSSHLGFLTKKARIRWDHRASYVIFHKFWDPLLTERPDLADLFMQSMMTYTRDNDEAIIIEMKDYEW